MSNVIRMPRPTGDKQTVPVRRPNRELRTREYLLEGEVERLRDAARKRGRHQHRDATLILVMYRHGLRVSEACALRWDQVDWKVGELHVTRKKNGRPSVHPIRGDELRALRRLQREQAPQSPFVFTTERGGPMTPAGVQQMLRRSGDIAGLHAVHPHMLRHGCGYALQAQGAPTRTIQAWLGHADITHTVRYTELSSTPFADVWRGRD